AADAEVPDGEGEAERALAALELDDEPVADELDARLSDEPVAAVELDGGLVSVDCLDLDVAARDLDLELDRRRSVERAGFHVRRRGGWRTRGRRTGPRRSSGCGRSGAARGRSSWPLSAPAVAGEPAAAAAGRGAGFERACEHLDEPGVHGDAVEGGGCIEPGLEAFGQPQRDA